MQITYHMIIQKDNENFEVKALDCDWLHANMLLKSMREVFTEEDGWNVFLENVNGEKL